MPSYTLEVRCPTCADPHPLHIIVTLRDGPPKRESIGRVYDGKDIPKALEAVLRENVAFCGRERRFIHYTDTQSHDDYLLVPLVQMMRD